MKEIIIIVIILGWLICSVLSHGFFFACCRVKFRVFTKDRYWEDFKMSLLWSLCGPITLVALFLRGTTKYGLKFW